MAQILSLVGKYAMFTPCGWPYICAEFVNSNIIRKKEKTVEISRDHNEERGLGEFDTHRIY